MKENDYLKEILGKVDQVHESIDFEGSIIKAIQKEKQLKLTIAGYKSKGQKALLVSGILIILLVLFFSRPSSYDVIEQAVVTYTFVGLVMIVLFFQLEIGSSFFYNHSKNDQS